ncbi:MAG: hypothetical protein WC928_02265 [Patescibacteria group bacterium]|jgi:predicted nuclease with TOPRIM domain
MIAKLNEIRQLVYLKENEISQLRERLSKLEGEKKNLEKDLNLAEDLAKQTADDGFIKLRRTRFERTPNSVEFGRSEDHYCSAATAIELLLKGEVYDWSAAYCGGGWSYVRI